MILRSPCLQLKKDSKGESENLSPLSSNEKYLPYPRLPYRCNSSSHSTHRFCDHEPSGKVLAMDGIDSGLCRDWNCIYQNIMACEGHCHLWFYQLLLKQPALFVIYFLHILDPLLLPLHHGGQDR